MSREPITINGKQYVYDETSRTHRRIEDIAAKAGDCAAGSAPDMELPARNESVQAKQGLPFNSPVNITVVSYRARLCDTDGVSAKAAIDGLVRCGVLHDDSPAYVSEVRYRQVKVKNASEEQTVIEIEAV